MSDQSRSIDPQCELSSLREVVQGQRDGRLAIEVPPWLHVMARFLGKRFVEKSGRFYVVEFTDGFMASITVEPGSKEVEIARNISAFVAVESERYDENCQISESLGKPKPRMSDDVKAFRKWNAAIEKFVEGKRDVSNRWSEDVGPWRCIDMNIDIGGEND